MTDLVIVENLNAMEVFTSPEKMDDVIENIKAQVNGFEPDMTTAKGRKDIASLAYKIAQSKSALDKAGKDLTEDVRNKINMINAERNRVKSELQALQDSVRKPLTEWENAEKERVDNHENKISEIINIKNDYSIQTSILARQAIFKLDVMMDREWQEFSDKARKAYEDTYSYLENKIQEFTRQENERAELERLRKEAEEREKKEREERIAKEAAERARLEAEAKAKAEREEIERKAREEKEAAERARLEAEAKAKAEREEIERKAREEKEAAERARLEAEAKAKAAEDAAKIAAQKERERIEFEKQLEEQEAKKREADKRHKSSINNAALSALTKAGLPEDMAKIAVTEIAKGNIPNVKISY